MLTNGRTRPAASWIVGAGLLLSLAATLRGDDRDLVRQASADPYVFILFDVSGSMNWQPAGDGWAPGSGDDPSSKFYQAKSAVFRALTDPDLQGVKWGFATYNQDFLTVLRKHWLYTPVHEPSWSVELPYPFVGMAKHFGDHCMDWVDSGTGCNFDGNDTAGSCSSSRDLGSAEQLGELVSYPVLGDAGTTTTWEWIRYQGRRFRLEWRLAGGALGDAAINVELRLRERDSKCEKWIGSEIVEQIQFTSLFTVDNEGRPLTASPASDTLVWQIDSHTDGTGSPAGFFSWNPRGDSYATNTCSGWDANTSSDNQSDRSGGQNLRYPFQSDPAGRGFEFGRGDVVPLDWQDALVWPEPNLEVILKRMAPNWDPSSGSSVPDFRVAPYFEDHPDSLFPDSSSGRLALRPQYQNTPPIIPWGATPIGNSMRDFMNWFDTWVNTASGPNGDPQLACRSVNLLILTDGDETCYRDGDGDPATGTIDGSGNANPCWIASRLLNEGNRNIKTYVVGFGVEGANANFLRCIADNGGTGINDPADPTDDGPGPILPGNEQELVDALKEIITLIKSGQRTFASAAVPQAQANVPDKIYLTSFQPTDEAAVWPGRVDAFLKPVPLTTVQIQTANGFVDRQVPDRNRVCQTGDTSACRLWDAGEEVLQQAPTDASTGNFNLGLGTGQRRVYYAPAGGGAVPRLRKQLEIPVDLADWQDLLAGFGICDAADTTCAADPANQAEGSAILQFLHERKRVRDPQNPTNFIDYVLGDVFHSDPLVVGNPNNFTFWVGDLMGSGSVTLDDPCGTSPTGYRCFVATERNRRRMLMVGANDGELHAFDAGVFQGQCRSNAQGGQFVEGEFDNGTGRELFAFVPREVMPTLRQQVQVPAQQFSVDGSVVAGDVFIDPVHSGVPTPEEREWRTLLLGGLREGGTGYFALDITQPDELADCNGLPVLPQTLNGSYVPSCTATPCARDVGLAALPFPSILWTFTDSDDCVQALPNGQCDDDGNGRPDLAETWSVPNVGPIRVLENNQLVTKFVAVFGGGLDPQNKTEPFLTGGRYLYMVDMETGKAIYKRPLDGAAPSTPAAVDLDQDGILDAIYIGTTAGILYKVDLQDPMPLVDVNGAQRVAAEEWDPFPIFDTGSRPIYFPPSVIFVAKLGRYGLSFGTGDREDLWESTGVEGRFYVILDQILTPTGLLREFRREDFLAGLLPRTESSYQRILVTDAVDETANFLLNPGAGFDNGWFLVLDPDERVITASFALAGITIFSSFQPQESIAQGGAVCSRGGDSRAFAVLTTNANPLGSGQRARLIADFVTQPFTEGSQTKNIATDTGPTSDDLTDSLQAILDALKQQFPPNCRFSNTTINLKTLRSDTGIEFIAPIPVCTVQKNWKEF